MLSATDVCRDIFTLRNIDFISNSVARDSLFAPPHTQCLKLETRRSSSIPHRQFKQCNHYIAKKRGNVACSVSESGTEQIAIEDHGSFLRNVACVDPPALLPSLLRVLVAQGEELVSPRDRLGMIPIVVPLTKNPKTALTTALLRWPTAPEGMELPVVRVEKSGVSLISKSISDYIKRALVEEDSSALSGGEDAIRVAAGEEGGLLYTKGSFMESGIEKMDVFLFKKIGLFPDVFERLAHAHLARGDETSALVTGEFYATRKHFPGFGRPFVFNAELLQKVGRGGEARDSARIALKSPWWTLGASYQEIAAVAGWGDAQLEFARDRISDEGRAEDLNKGKAPAQVALDQAAFLLDVTSAEGSWDKSRQRLAALYEEGGLPEIAAFIRAGSE